MSSKILDDLVLKILGVYHTFDHITLSEEFVTITINWTKTNLIKIMLGTSLLQKISKWHVSVTDDFKKPVQL